MGEIPCARGYGLICCSALPWNQKPQVVPAFTQCDEWVMYSSQYKVCSYSIIYSGFILLCVQHRRAGAERKWKRSVKMCSFKPNHSPSQWIFCTISHIQSMATWHILMFACCSTIGHKSFLKRLWKTDFRYSSWMKWASALKITLSYGSV